MTGKQFLWGLSGGVTILAIAGAFWLGLGMSDLPRDMAGPFWVLAMIVEYGGLGRLLWLGRRLRQESGFHQRDFRNSDEAGRAETRRIMSGFFWVAGAQAILVALAVCWCVHGNRRDLIWPWMGLIVSLHFAPLARIFHVRVYYATAIGGSIASLAGFVLADSHKLAILGGAMGAVMWGSAWYILTHANRIADSAVREPWAMKKAATAQGGR